MNKFGYLAAFAVAAPAFLGSAPVLGQTLLLDVNQTIPLAATLDNPCTGQLEAIAFQGSAQLAQRVWAMPSGTVRLQTIEQTTMQGQDTAALLGGSAKYAFTGTSGMDAEFNPGSASIMNYKKVIRDTGTADNFHAILIMDFDPSTLKLNLKIGGACDDGSPQL
jgi:hypothetical protein